MVRVRVEQRDDLREVNSLARVVDPQADGAFEIAHRAMELVVVTALPLRCSRAEAPARDGKVGPRAAAQLQEHSVPTGNLIFQVGGVLGHVIIVVKILRLLCDFVGSNTKWGRNRPQGAAVIMLSLYCSIT